MTKLDRFSSIILVAALAAGAGWGASAFTHSKNNVVETPAPTTLTTVPLNSFQAPDQNAINNASAQPFTVAAPEAVPAAKTLTVEAPAAAPVTRRTATRPRVVNDQAYQRASDNARYENRDSEYRSARSERYEPRKKGLSNKTKTAIAIGGAAATGAAIGGIAKGGKGAAIGAIIGGGGGALYSWIKHKQNKPVF